MLVLSVGLEVPDELGGTGESWASTSTSHKFAETDPCPGGDLAAGRLHLRHFPGTQGHSRFGHRGERRGRPPGNADPPPRHARTDTRIVVPDEIDIAGQEPRSAFSSATAASTSEASSTSRRQEYARSFRAWSSWTTTCSPAARTPRTRSRKNQGAGLNRVVVASCSPKTHEPMFMETLGGVRAEQVPVRDGQYPEPGFLGACQQSRARDGKAKDLVRMAVARSRTLKPLAMARSFRSTSMRSYWAAASPA
jgi:hypothetical protein